MDTNDPSPPARMEQIGRALDGIATPVLAMDWTTLTRNVGEMARLSQLTRVALRPHVKTHKSVEIARLQMGHGAAGIACQKVSEASVFASAGISNITVTNEIVGMEQLRRVRELNEHSEIAILVDSMAGIDRLQETGFSSDRPLSVLIEVRTSNARAGVESQPEILRLAERVSNDPRLLFAGIQAYNGPAQHLPDYQDRKRATQRLATRVASIVDDLLNAGLPTPTVTGGGTGTARLEAETGVFTEIQPGTYAVMDAGYSELQFDDSDPQFDQAVFVASTIISRPDPSTAILDAGVKAIGVDRGMPIVAGLPGAVVTACVDEASTVSLPDGPSRQAEVGDVLLLVPVNCDPTINLYHRFCRIEGDAIVDWVGIEAHGSGW